MINSQTTYRPRKFAASNGFRILFLYLLLLQAGLFAQPVVEVGGVLTENTVWSSGFIYVVTEDVIVGEAVLLQIAPGTEVRFNQGRGLFVSGGQLLIDGTADEKVLLVPNHSGSETWNWNGITVSSIEEPGSILINQAFINKAVIGIKANAGNHLLITNNTVSNNLFVGISLFNSSDCVIEGNQIHENFLGIEIFSTDPANESSDNLVTGNHFANTTTNMIVHNSNQGGLTGNIITENFIENGVHGIWLFKSGHQGHGNVTVTRNIIINNGTPNDGYGIYVSMDSTYMSENILWRNTTAVSFREVNHCVLANNSLYENDRAIELRSSATGINMLNNTITGNAGEVLILNQHEGVVFQRNNLFANRQSEAAVVNNTATDIFIPENFWGTLDADIIDALIFDANDDPASGELVYKPLLPFADTTAPVSPPRQVTARLVEGTVKLSWLPNPEADLAGYNVHWGEFGHYFFTNSSGLILDTVFQLADLPLDSPIAVTALDNTAGFSESQLSGNESPFAFATLIPYAGEDSTICRDEPFYAITQSTAPFQYDSLYWQTRGDGGFDNNELIRPVYSAGAADIENKSVWLIMTVLADDKVFTDSLNLKFAIPPMVFAGQDAIISPDSSFTPVGTSTEHYTQLLWTTTGDGTFDDATSLTPVYTPGPADVINKGAALILEASNAYCGPVADTLTLTIRRQFSVEGRVWAGADLLPELPVIGLRISENGESSIHLLTFTDDSGAFRFNNLFGGEYVFYAVCDTTSENQYLPAYHPNRLRWQEAFMHDLTGDIFDLDIYLPTANNDLPPGVGSISGLFLLPRFSAGTLDSFCQPWFGDSGQVFCDDGLSNITVLLFGASGQVVYDFTLTDADGRFSFSGLPFGSYRLEVEIAGYESAASGIITLSPDNPFIEDITLEIEPQLKVGIYLPERSLTANPLHVYPNPATDMIYLTGDIVSGSELLTVRIFNATGLLVKNSTIISRSGHLQIDVRELKSGIYFVQLSGYDGAASFSFVKTYKIP
jgi:parallel beta-helix repeat protein